MDALDAEEVTNSLFEEGRPHLIALECRSAEETTIVRHGQSIVDGCSHLISQQSSLARTEAYISTASNVNLTELERGHCDSLVSKFH